MGRRMADLEGSVKGLTVSVGSLDSRVSKIEAYKDQTVQQLASIQGQLALQQHSMTTIERGVTKLENARDSDGVKFRHVLQIAVSIFAIAVSVVALILKST